MSAFFTTDKSEWMRLFLDTPFTGLVSAARRAQLAPGTCVQHTNGRHFGRVHKNPDSEASPSSSEAIVIGHGLDNESGEKFVWRGDVRDFRLEWRID